MLSVTHGKKSKTEKEGKKMSDFDLPMSTFSSVVTRVSSVNSCYVHVTSYEL